MKTLPMRTRGRCWTFGDNIPTDRLVKTKYVVEPMEVIVQHVLEDLNPRFPLEVAPGDVVVAGKHFGQSSGRAIAVKALRATGVGCVVAETFARTFYRNAFEVGLPVLELPGVAELVSDGDVLTVDVSAGTFRNETTGAERQVPPPDGFLLEMLRAGGLIALAKGRRDLFDPETSFRDASRTAAPRSSVMPDQ
jgi:3-isopropylmalate/(R)-2-methylmalate dehydratase small subunit